MILNRFGKIACVVIGTFALLYLGAFADLWTPLEDYSPVSFADDPIQIILNSTFSPSNNSYNQDLCKSF